MAASLTPRFGRTAGQIFYAERISQSYNLIAAGTTTLSAAPKAYDTIYVAQAAMTSNLTVNAVTTSAKLGDQITFLFLADTTARVVTFGTDFISGGTVTAAISKRASATFKFDGVKFVEISRFVQP